MKKNDTNPGKKEDNPFEIPAPDKMPEQKPLEDPQDPIWPIEEPDDFPEEDPYETPPFEIPPPGEGP